MIRPADLARRPLSCALLLAVMPWPEVAAAQGAPSVVQALPDPAQQRLNDSLRVLSRDPRSVLALVAAAEASLALDDIDAAAGFIRRAEAVAPYDGRVKAGRAQLLVRQQQPVEALRLFAEAEQVGALTVAHIGDRGLAFDLIGDNVHAQDAYAVALSAGANPAISRRLALSQAIVGDQRASETTLLPMLQRSDLAAFRTRAFALAILGKSDEAVSIAETMLPERLSSRLGPYLRYMPRLTRAQQAAAANLGVFPQAAQIGRDDPAMAAYSPQAGAALPVRTADARLVPSGEPLGSRSGVPRREETPVVRAAVQPPASPPPTSQPPASPTFEPSSALAGVTASQNSIGSAPSPAAVEVPLAAPPTPVAAVQPVLTPDVVPPEPRNLAAAFADFALPSGAAVAPAPEAVDITKIAPRRETPRVQAPAPSPKPVVPSRQWVQVATGRDTAALAFDWRRIKREAGRLLDRTGPHVVAWGQTNRLVVGPFADAREADQLVTKLKEKDIDTFRFTSAQGEDVKVLD